MFALTNPLPVLFATAWRQTQKCNSEIRKAARGKYSKQKSEIK